MTKHELADMMSARINLSKSDCLMAIDGFIEVMNEALNNKNDIFLRGFGTFSIVNRKEKLGRLIKEGKSVVIPAYAAVKFKPCDKLKKNIANG
jgi:DNA-binding protein HU-beta